MKYQLIDHTADFGIHVFGTDAKDLFINAASALFDQIVERGEEAGEKKCAVQVTGQDWQDLMVNWLRELLFLWAARQMMIKNTDITSICQNELKAVIEYGTYHPEYQDSNVIKNEIKAVTYHQIMVQEKPTGWESKIIFDV